jgi:hypothetical protein
MRSAHALLIVAPCCLGLPAACSSSTAVQVTAGGNGGAVHHPPPDGGSGAAGPGGSPASDGGDSGGADGEAGAPVVDTIDGNRNRLLCTYLAYLQANPSETQSNGLSGSNVSSVSDLWQKLDPSSQAVFLTLTARMQGSILGDDGSSMLSHITKVYRITGGQGATAQSPGSCGGGEYNRMIMSMDAHLHASQLAANQHKGAIQGNSKYDIADIPPTSFWRDSHDLGGPHPPFDLSDETNQGAPRGQTQYFSDPSSKAATSPLGRMDLTTLVDPYAIEMDQDYDCVHNSNPICSYVTYGPLCLPMASALGTDIYQTSYGSFGAGWKPTGC